MNNPVVFLADGKTKKKKTLHISPHALQYWERGVDGGGCGDTVRAWDNGNGLGLGLALKGEGLQGKRDLVGGGEKGHEMRM